MPYSQSHVRISWLFGLQNAPDELALTDLKVATPGMNDAAARLLADGLDLDQLYLDYLNMVASGAGLEWASYSRLTGVRVAPVGTNGKEVDDPREVALGPNAGTGGQVNAQLSVVVSLRSGTRLGRANYGRMFLPHTRLTQTASSPFAPTPDNFKDRALAFLNAVNANADEAGAGARIVNMSQVTVPETKTVTQVWIGNVTDTQRRRRNQLQEVYSQGLLD